MTMTRSGETNEQMQETHEQHSPDVAQERCFFALLWFASLCFSCPSLGSSQKVHHQVVSAQLCDPAGELREIVETQVTCRNEHELVTKDMQ